MESRVTNIDGIIYFSKCFKYIYIIHRSRNINVDEV